MANRLAKIKAALDPDDYSIIPCINYEWEDHCRWLIVKVERLKAAYERITTTWNIDSIAAELERKVLEVERLEADAKEWPCENCGRMTRNRGEEIICSRCEGREAAANVFKDLGDGFLDRDAIQNMILAAAKEQAEANHQNDEFRRSRGK